MTALEKADAADLVRRFDEGLDAHLGKQFGGTELSGGEWQKIALARCLVRDADLLVLDEPSAALDVEAEYGLHLKFREIMRGRMCVPVSNRLATVRMADRIVVLEDGRIKEQGTHEDLMALGGNLRPALQPASGQVQPVGVCGHRIWLAFGGFYGSHHRACGSRIAKFQERIPQNLDGAYLRNILRIIGGVIPDGEDRAQEIP